MRQPVKKIGIISLAALAIALFMTLPRLVIVTYFQTNPHPRMSDVTWWDLASKCFYSFLIAWVFLGLNVMSGTPLTSVFRPVNLSRLSHRLAMNLVLLILIKCFFRLLGIPETSELRSGRGAVFLFNISLVLEAAFCILAGEIYRLLKRNQQQRLNNEMLLKANAEATFEVLKNQVNPHFLFNSLNTINAMIDRDVNAAKKFVTNMSQVYRHILNSAGRPSVILAEELEFTRAYIHMLLERHSKSLFIDTTIPDAYNVLLLPPVSLQLLIENAVKHNIVSVSNPLLITISGKDGYITVANKINERKLSSASTGTGLLNLDQRYRHLCGGKIEISNKEGVFSVSLPLLKLSDGKYVLGY
jgi:sensor histidine kinase YesM